MKDKYDKEIDQLMSASPDKFIALLVEHWTAASPLFQFMSKSGRSGGNCNCPTMVKGIKDGCSSKRVKKEILSSPLIPACFADIEQDELMLNEFARIQRLADIEFKRVV